MLFFHMDTIIRHFQDYVATVAAQLRVRRLEAEKRLPGYLSQPYVLLEITVEERRFLGVLLKDSADFRPAAFEKQLRQLLTIVKDFEGYCLIAQSLPSYVRARLVERKIPFVVPGQQLYWPDLGLALQARRKNLAPNSVAALSPASQAVLIYVLTQTRDEPVTPKLLAEQLDYSAMSMTRALNEIEGNELAQIVRFGRERLLVFTKDRRSLWEAALPYLRSPVRQTIRIKYSQLPPEWRIKAGETALAALSMLAPPREPVCALGREAWKHLEKSVVLIPVEEDDTCCIQLWRYDPSLFAQDGRVDCFSLYLSLRDEDDERVQGALEEMMEKTAWL